MAALKSYRHRTGVQVELYSKSAIVGNKLLYLNTEDPAQIETQLNAIIEEVFMEGYHRAQRNMRRALGVN